MKPKKGHKGKTNTAVKVPAPMNQSLLTDIRDLILSARRQVAQAVNAGLTMLNWEIGRRIRQDILEEKRATYGKEIVAALGRQLSWTHFKSLIPIERQCLRHICDRLAKCLVVEYISLIPLKAGNME